MPLYGKTLQKGGNLCTSTPAWVISLPWFPVELWYTQTRLLLEEAKPETPLQLHAKCTPTPSRVVRVLNNNCSHHFCLLLLVQITCPRRCSLQHIVRWDKPISGSFKMLHKTYVLLILPIQYLLAILWFPLLSLTPEPTSLIFHVGIIFKYAYKKLQIIMGKELKGWSTEAEEWGSFSPGK